MSSSQTVSHYQRVHPKQYIQLWYLMDDISSDHTTIYYNVLIHIYIYIIIYVYIYSHPGLDGIWNVQTSLLKSDYFWKSPYSIYFRMTIYTYTYIHWLVVDKTPLKNMTSSIGMMKFPIYGKIQVMFQSPPTRYMCFPYIWVN